MGFKSKVLPSIEVLKVHGSHCLAIFPKTRVEPSELVSSDGQFNRPHKMTSMRRFFERPSAVEFDTNEAWVSANPVTV